MAVMRRGFRMAGLPVVALVVCAWLLLIMRFKDIRPRGPERPAKPPADALRAVEIVVASTQRENTSWVHRNLPDWSHSIYVVDDTSAKLTVPQNKGREAMVYLT
jgi:hypothetical protein